MKATPPCLDLLGRVAVGVVHPQVERVVLRPRVYHRAVVPPVAIDSKL